MLAAQDNSKGCRVWERCWLVSHAVTRANVNGGITKKAGHINLTRTNGELYRGPAARLLSATWHERRTTRGACFYRSGSLLTLSVTFPYLLLLGRLQSIIRSNTNNSAYFRSSLLKNVQCALRKEYIAKTGNRYTLSLVTSSRFTGLLQSYLNPLNIPKAKSQLERI